MEKPSVLIVDDNDATLTLVTALLRRDFHVEAATDGREAVEKLKSRRFAAVLLDLRMPQLDGFGVLDFLQSHHPAVLPTVLVVTAALTKPEIARANAYGVCGIISKPFEVETLLDAVNHCVASDEPRPLGNLFSSGMLLLLADMIRQRLM